MLGDQALYKLIRDYDFDTVLDIGSGDGDQARAFRRIGKSVLTISLIPPARIVGDFNDAELPAVDCIWASHVLEHQRNVGAFLDKCYRLLNDDGVLAITVPPLKHEIVGGHVSLWNAGILLYNLVLAGFDCSRAAVKTYGYNVSVIVKKKPAELPGIIMDMGDIDRLGRFFPMTVGEGFDGKIISCNWED